MTLKQWEDHGWLRAETTSRSEISNLLAIVERDLKDASAGISLDWKFGIAYNAALKLCTILLRAEGYRPAHGLQHYRTIAAMPFILGHDRKPDADYLDACRTKRNRVEYDYIGGVSAGDVMEIMAFVSEFRTSVLHWMKDHHPELL